MKRKYLLSVLLLSLSMAIAMMGCDFVGDKSSGKNKTTQESDDDDDDKDSKKKKDKKDKENKTDKDSKKDKKKSKNAVEFTLYGDGGEDIYTFSLPDDYELSYSSDDGTFHTVAIVEYSEETSTIYYEQWTFLGSVLMGDILVDYILDGKEPSEDQFDYFDCSYKKETVGRTEFYLETCSFSWPESDDVYTEYSVLIPYTNVDGDDWFAEIKISGGAFEEFWEDPSLLSEIF